MLTFFVEGTPVAQPRPRACIRGTHASVYDPGTADEWKAAVTREAAMFPTWSAGPTRVKVWLEFVMPRPASHYRSNGTIKPSAPAHHVKKPDVDNLAKAALDALVSSLRLPDDACVAPLIVDKRYAIAGEKTGCFIEITPIEVGT